MIIDKLLKPRTIICVVLVYCMLLFAYCIAFAGSAWSSKGYFTVYTYNYANKSYIATTSSQYHGYTYIEATNKMAPAGYMGAQTRLYMSSNDALLASSSMVYSGSTMWSFGSPSVFKSASSGSYYSKGLTKVYNGNGYSSYTSFKSPSQTIGN